MKKNKNTNYDKNEADWAAEDSRNLARRFSNRTWKTRSGQKIKFKDLSNSHLNNILAMLERKGHQESRKYKNLQREKQRRQKIKENTTND